MVYRKPRVIIAALRGGSGKTMVSLGLLAAWKRLWGRRLIAFKKGPDYIDAGWLGLAAGGDCYNLDPFLMAPDAILASFVHRSWQADGCLIEGNRGLYDGVDVEGTCSSAEVAKLLRAPVILVVDATKMTRTAAALVKGCQELDADVDLAGVIVNRVAGGRHERILRATIERYCDLPVVGVIPKDAFNIFPERHMGLVPAQEHRELDRAMAMVAEKMKGCVDLDRLWNIACRAESLGLAMADTGLGAETAPGEGITIGVVRDQAFQFYYPENLEALRKAGATVKEISSLEAGHLPALDALYIGGGFPETHLEQLYHNGKLRESIRRAVENGLPVYAECGGLMYLSRGIHHQQKYYPMVGVFPCDVVLGKKPQGHGYTVVECVRENPFIPRGLEFRGHEFHYSRVVDLDSGIPFALRLKKGHGIVHGHDGMCYRNVMASYSHLHAVGNEFWAEAMVTAARNHRREAVDCRCEKAVKHQRLVEAMTR